jgi:cell shape-determining protein MreC
MNWSRRNDDTSLRRAIVLTLIIIIIGLFDVVLSGQLRTLVRDALTPFANTVTSVWQHVLVYGNLSGRAELLQQVQTLEAERNRLRERDVLFHLLAQENAELRALAAVATTSEAITAPVASSFRASPYGTFVIAAGWRDGIERDSLVLSSEGFVLGTIEDIGMRTAIVRFVFTPGGEIEAVSGVSAFTLTGQSLGSASTQVPLETPLTIGDMVYAPTLESRPIGVISHIASTTAAIYSDIYVNSPVSLHSLRHVRVVPRDTEPVL